MLYFWFSEQVLDSLAKAAFQDGRLTLSLTGDKFKVRGRAAGTCMCACGVCVTPVGSMEETGWQAQAPWTGHAATIVLKPSIY